MTASRRGTALDIALFLAVSNVHVVLADLFSVPYSTGLLPVSFAILASWAVITDRVLVLLLPVVFSISAFAFFAVLALLRVPFPPVTAYVISMQTATGILFIEYLRSLSPVDVRDALRALRRLLVVYLAVFAALATAIRMSGDMVLFNQVAQSNYAGLLSTYVVLGVVAGAADVKWRRRSVVVAIGANILGQQRASLLLNVVLGAMGVLKGRVVRVTLAVLVAAGAVYVFAPDSVLPTVRDSWAWMLRHAAALRLEYWQVEEVIRRAVVDPASGYDASVLLRAVSMIYVTSEVVQHPFLPAATLDYGYLSNSHSLVLEYFKAGGLFFVVLCGAMLLNSYARLFRRFLRLGYRGLACAAVYTFLFNDLYLGMLLLPIALDHDKLEGGDGAV